MLDKYINNRYKNYIHNNQTTHNIKLNYLLKKLNITNIK